MKKRLRITTTLVATLILTVTVAALSVVYIFKPKHFKTQISQIVYQQTGRRLEIKGDIHLSVFPWIKVAMEHVKLENKPGFTQKTFAEVGEVAVNIRFLPLLTGQVKFGKLTLDNLHLNLIKKKTGQTNWQDLIGNENAHKNEDPSKSQENNQEKAHKDTSVLSEISGIHLQHSSINFVNEQLGSKILLKDIRLTSGKISTQRPFRVQINCHLISTNPNLNMLTSASSLVSLNKNTGEIKLQDLVMSNNLYQHHNHDHKLTINVETNVYINQRTEAFDINSLVLTANNLKLQGALHGKTSNGKQHIDGSVEIPPFSLVNFLDRFGIKMKSNNTLSWQNTGLSFKLAASNNHIIINHLKAQLDNTQIKGKARLTEKKSTFDISANRLKVDDYFPVTFTHVGISEAKQTGPAGSNNSKSQTKQKAMTPTPSPLTHYEIDGNIKLAKLLYKQIKSDHVHVKVRAKDAIIHMPTTASLYHGKYKGQFNINLQKALTAYGITADLSHIAMQPFLQDAANMGRLSGSGHLHLSVHMAGDNSAKMINSLRGKGSFKVNNGTLHGINLFARLQQAFKALTPSSTKVDTSENTRFISLTGTTQIRNGIVNNRDLKLHSNLLNISGKGHINLPKSTINYRLNVTTLAMAGSEHVKLLSVLSNRSVPILVSGPLDNPSYTVDPTVVANILQEVLGLPVSGAGTITEGVTKGVGKTIVPKIKKTLEKVLPF